MGTVGGAPMYTRAVVQQHRSISLSLTGFLVSSRCASLTSPSVVTVEKSGLRLTEHTLTHLPRKNSTEGSPPPPIGGRRESPALYGLTMHHLSRVPKEHGESASAPCPVTRHHSGQGHHASGCGSHTVDQMIHLAHAAIRVIVRSL